jgi:hypothetical protein
VLISQSLSASTKFFAEPGILTTNLFLKGISAAFLLHMTSNRIFQKGTYLNMCSLSLDFFFSNTHQNMCHFVFERKHQDDAKDKQTPKGPKQAKKATPSCPKYLSQV